MKSITEIQLFLEKNYWDNDLPEFILAQGDTNTVFASAVVSFLNKIKFAHLEAGLRTFDYFNPYPEEYYRRIYSLSSETNLPD